MSSKGLIIDTNLLLLLVIGSVEEGRHIRNSNRLNAYSKDDFDVVAQFMGKFNDVFITPYIAAEVSNLIDLNGYARDSAFQIVRVLLDEFKQVEVDLSKDAASDSFLIYGLTDNSLIDLVSDYTVITNDARLLGPLFAASPDNVIPFEFAKSLVDTGRS
ncbi:hypothetical protein PS910_00256 [Pseudomonas fluorescens]|nr:hypothetical protein PS910_00256 [Pseudomonas fluorescens]